MVCWLRHKSTSVSCKQYLVRSSGVECQCALLVKIGQTVGEIWLLNGCFQDCGRPPSWILKILKCYWPIGLRGSICANMPNVVSNCYRDIAIFQLSRTRLSTILNFKKREILTAGRVQRINMRHHAKTCLNKITAKSQIPLR